MASVSKRPWTYKGTTKEAWTVRYVDRDGKHRSRKCASKKDADAYCRQVENELESGNHVARGASRTYAALVEEYLTHLEDRVADGSLGRTRPIHVRRITKRSVDYLGRMLVVDIKWQDVERFYRSLYSAALDHTGKKISNGYSAIILTAMGTVLGWGVRRGYLAANPVPLARREIGAKPTDKIETFSREEMRKLIGTLVTRFKNGTRRMSVRQWTLTNAMVLTAVACGLRKGEILALTWEQIDFNRGLIHVKQSLTDRPFDEVKTTKTKAGVRHVPAPRVVLDALEACRPFYVENARGLIFRRSEGGPYAEHFYMAIWQPLLAAAGLEARNFHALRHYAGSAWLDAGASLPDVSRLLGHANVSITAKVYSHALDRPSEKAGMVASCAAALLPTPDNDCARDAQRLLSA